MPMNNNMANDIVEQKYGYKILLQYISKNGPVHIGQERMSKVLIDRSYDIRNMPIIYITLNMDKAVLDDMLLNDQKNYCTITMYKVLKDSPTEIKEEYFKDKYMYVITENPNMNKRLEYQDVDVTDYNGLDTANPNSVGNSYTETTIGFLSIDLLNKNKKLIYGTWKDANMLNVLTYYTSQMPLLIEPIRNTVLSNLIIPPFNSVTKLLEYLNNIYCFYTTPYRYFMDFDKSYLVSSSGKPTPAKGETIESIIIRAKDTEDELGKKEGQKLKITEKVHIIDVDVTQVNTTKNRIADKSFNTIVGIGTSGVKQELPLNMYNAQYSTKKYLIKRVFNDNIAYISKIKQLVEGTAMTIQINKSNLDASLFNINKEFNVNNFKTYKDMDGKYLLSSKKEIYFPDGDLFVMNTSLTLRKIMS